MSIKLARNEQHRSGNEKIDIYFIGIYVIFMKTRARFSPVFLGISMFHHEQKRKSLSIILIAWASCLRLINDGNRPGKRQAVPRNGCFYLPRDVSSSRRFFLLAPAEGRHHHRDTRSDITVIDLARRCRTVRVVRPGSIIATIHPLNGNPDCSRTNLNGINFRWPSLPS